MELVIKKFGDAVGVEIPADVFARLGLEPGDSLFLSEQADGAPKLQLRPSAQQVMKSGLESAERAMTTYEKTLEKLAK
ncbi:MAG: AbrB family transcriptional regulator [Pseudomonadota bacterium]